MAKKKPKAPKSPAKRKAPQKVSTKFMSAFTAEFIRDPKTKNRKWPAASQTDPSVMADFETFMYALMQAGFLLQPLVSGGSNSLSDRLAQFIAAQNWPVAALVPKKWQTIQPTVHLIEISVITDRLLQAINEPRAAGGTPSIWPPH
jgi:hypothetical protein